MTAPICACTCSLAKSAATQHSGARSLVPFSQPWDDAEGAAAADSEAQLAHAEPKASVARKTVDGVYTGTQPEGDVACAGAERAERVAA